MIQRTSVVFNLLRLLAFLAIFLAERGAVQAQAPRPGAPPAVVSFAPLVLLLIIIIVLNQVFRRRRPKAPKEQVTLCAFCTATIKAEAKFCRFCGREVRSE